jgi:hypothetical protein
MWNKFCRTFKETRRALYKMTEEEESQPEQDRSVRGDTSDTKPALTVNSCVSFSTSWNTT